RLGVDDSGAAQQVRVEVEDGVEDRHLAVDRAPLHVGHGRPKRNRDEDPALEVALRGANVVVLEDVHLGEARGERERVCEVVRAADRQTVVGVVRIIHRREDRWSELESMLLQIDLALNALHPVILDDVALAQSRCGLLRLRVHGPLRGGPRRRGRGSVFRLLLVFLFFLLVFLLFFGQIEAEAFLRDRPAAEEKQREQGCWYTGQEGSPSVEGSMAPGPLWATTAQSYRPLGGPAIGRRCKLPTLLHILVGIEYRGATGCVSVRLPTVRDRGDILKMPLRLVVLMSLGLLV